jgi:two-component system chemotaxis response regulator CheY
MRALVVDDSSTMRMILRNVLRKKGFEVLEGKDGFDAINVLKKSGPVELMLVDWNMPEMNGFDLLCHVRGDRQYDNTKIMMVTTETAMSGITRALESGANEYIMKPFTPDAVLEKLSILGW